MNVVRARTVAQAKINLILHVLARESGGYHRIETLICRLDFGDDVLVSADSDDSRRSLECAGDAMPPEGLGAAESNLAWRAAATYAEAAGWPAGFAIRIDKRIPVGGGLGGGSADAGAVLRCLDALAPSSLGTERLRAIAAALGSDVPALTVESPLVRAWGLGERVLGVPALPQRDVTLACAPPGAGVGTADAYRWIDESRADPGVDPAGAPSAESQGYLAAMASGDWEEIEPRIANDFEAVVLPRHRVAGVMHTALRNAGGGRVLLAGSGASVFQLGRPATPPTFPRGVRIVETRTATSIAPVERLPGIARPK
ncbi:MAG TPA: 4-(cytidine 5'-diphospho)-2-C-methyl-D-erythritol kinase [Gemmatimonadaceae bacterium]|nr:4-(cytidine 5'-diphospho)-2-C-methyl-D-erythritol kinase [Gemmatimonadaceae bacterium]